LPHKHTTEMIYNSSDSETETDTDDYGACAYCGREDYSEYMHTWCGICEDDDEFCDDCFLITTAGEFCRSCAKKIVNVYHEVKDKPRTDVDVSDETGKCDQCQGYVNTDTLFRCACADTVCRSCFFLVRSEIVCMKCARVIEAALKE
jgi:hypothetical protein